MMNASGKLQRLRKYWRANNAKTQRERKDAKDILIVNRLSVTGPVPIDL